MLDIDRDAGGERKFYVSRSREMRTWSASWCMSIDGPALSSPLPPDDEDVSSGDRLDGRV